MEDSTGGSRGAGGATSPVSAAEVWTGRASNRAQWLLAVAGAGCLALGIELAVDSSWASGLTALVMSVVGCLAAGVLVLFGTLAFTHVRVRVDGDCVEVRCGHIGVPRRRIPLDQVDSARLAPWISPRNWGGWGYRWRPEMGTAVIVRRGPGIVVDLGGGRLFTVTVDDPEGAVRAIRDRLRTAGPRGARRALGDV
ncbi:hypothetical protein ABZ832_29320 [Streptantibioticus parmotrematis]|uniref:hypothetical protein n=1 Tax=Streptantibioticus parmotrematis TaxID=2873249 RepID=UPI0034001794